MAHLLEHLFILVSGPHQLLNEAVREVPAEHVRHEEGWLLQGPADNKKSKGCEGSMCSAMATQAAHRHQNIKPTKHAAQPLLRQSMTLCDTGDVWPFKGDISGNCKDNKCL